MTFVTLRVKYVASTDDLAYQYAHSDRIGTTRVLYEPSTSAVRQYTSTYAYGYQIAELSSSTGKFPNQGLYHGKELTDAHGLNGYHYGARFYDVARAQWTTMDPADEFHTPYSYVGGDPVNLTDPDGRSSCDIVLCGQNGSSVTIETDLINAEVDVSDLPGTDFGGNYTLNGEDVLLAGLDILGTVDPTPISDGLAASIYVNQGNWLDAGISTASFIPYIGDVAKLSRATRQIGVIRDAVISLDRGGLNLYKFKKHPSSRSSGWLDGDRMLYLPDRGSPQANWKQNSGALRREMRMGDPIYDSYRDPISGEQIPTGGFLNAERHLLESRGWKYNSDTGAYHPPND